MPGAAALAGIVDFAISLLVLSVMMIYYKYVPTLALLSLPFLTIFAFFLAVSFSLFFSAMNVRYRDVRFVMGYILQLWMYATPVVYPYSLIPEKYRLIALLNPMVGVIEGFRWCLLGQPFPGLPLLSSFIFCVIAFFFGQAYFRRVERSFADVI